MQLPFSLHTFPQRIYRWLNETARFLLPPSLSEPLYHLVWRLKIASKMGHLAKIEIQPSAQSYPCGVNFIADVNPASGLGESSRLVLKTLRLTQEKLALVPDAVSCGLGQDDFEMGQGLLYDINIIHIQPSSLASALQKFGPDILAGHYNIGFWLWELEKFPKAWQPALALFNEIWTPAEFISRAIRQESDVPIVTMPYAVAPQTRPEYDRRYFGLPEDCFLIMTACDSFSILGRKNPLGAALAFIRAFPPEEGQGRKVGLVLKLRHLPLAWRRRFRKMLAAYPHIYFIEDTLSKEEVNGLLKCVDVFLSPHRAEGFGLMLAEAMYLGTPCVATNWSANVEFMSPDTAALLDYELVEIGRNLGPFPKEGRWAEPDIGQAAAWLRRLAAEPALSQTFSAAAAQHIRKILTPETLAAKMSLRLGQIREGRKAAP